METTKYIIVQEYGEWPVMFSACLKHKDIAGFKHVISAGFCKLNEAGKWEAYGESDSLGLRSRPVEDSQLLNFSFVTMAKKEY